VHDLHAPVRRSSTFLLSLGASVALLLNAAPVGAQSIVDAHRAEFLPSPDNDAIAADGTPVVQKYSLWVYVAGGSTPFATADLGKPAPGPDGFIRVDFSTLLSTPLQPGVFYEGRVSADGPGGSSQSAVSNMFVLTTTCSATLSVNSLSVGSGSATGSADVAAACAWTALSNASWLTVTSGAPGTGNGTVGFSVDANTATSPRSGTLTIAGNTFTVNQAAVHTDPTVLSVSSTSVPTSSPVTVTITNGLGGGLDWIAFAPTSAPYTSYFAYTYVGSGVTTRTWTITTPSTPGTYEFRYFPNNGYTPAAISQMITVSTTSAPVPVVSSMSPVAAAAGGSGFTLTVNGSSFTTASVVRWNGSDRATTFLGATQLQAAIGPADIAAIGTAQVTVFTPAPGGGTSASLTFTIGASPTLSVNTTTAAPGTSVTVTLSGGLGGASDWLALAATSAPNTSYIAYTYVGSGVTTRTWTVLMPQQTGTYEFRLFLNNGYMPAATSPAVTVAVVAAPVPVITSLSPSSAVASAGGFSLTVNGSDFTAASVVNWNGSPRATTFVSSAQLQAAIAAADIASVGTAQVTVFTPTPGGGTSASLTFTIVQGPTLSVSATTAAPGTSVTVTLSGGLGGASDWLALAATSAPDLSYVAYTYVGSGVTTRTWTVLMPQQTGTYEFRLFLNNGFTRVATSPPVTVQ